MSLQISSAAQTPSISPSLESGNVADAAAESAASAGSETRSTPEPFYNLQLDTLTAAMFGRTPGASGASLPTSFDALVRGTAARPIDLELAQVSRDVYDTTSNGVGNWSRLDAAQLTQAGIDPSSLEDPSTGFRAAIYSDGKGDFVLAFAGSNDAKDWLNNAQQGVGLDSAQYAQATALGVDAKAAFGDNLVVTGHSLGGGLASTAAIATGSAAVTFNASGVSDNTIKGLGLDPAQVRQQTANGEIRRYAVDGEALTTAQEKVPVLSSKLPDALGHKIALHDPDPVEKPKNHWYDWLDGVAEKNEIKYAVDVVKHSGELHGIDPVLQALQNDRPWNP